MTLQSEDGDVAWTGDGCERGAFDWVLYVVVGAASVSFAVYIILGLGFDLPDGVVPSDGQAPSEEQLRETAFLSARQIAWSIPGGFVAVTLGVGICLALDVLRSRFGRRWSLVVFAVAVAAAVVSLREGSAILDDFFISLGGGRRDTELANAATIMGSIAAAACVAIGAAMFACAIPMEDDEDLSDRVRWHRWLLFLAATGLTAGAVSAHARIELAIAPSLYRSADQGGLALASEAALSAAYGYGGMFTLLLFMIYVPTSVMLQRQRAAAGVGAGQAVKPGSPRAGIVSHLAESLAVFAPLLAPFIENLL